MDIRYEYTVVQHGMEWLDEFNERVLGYREEGWEECGQVDIDSSKQIPIIRVPMRRQLID